MHNSILLIHFPQDRVKEEVDTYKVMRRSKNVLGREGNKDFDRKPSGD